MSKNFETERKFLIVMPDAEALCALPGASLSYIVQTYLTSEEGVTARVRRRENAAGVKYTATEKRRVSAMTAIEDERVIGEEEYSRLLLRADPALRPIEKRRISIPWEGLLAEIDIYPFWQRTAILEVELPSEDVPFSPPPFVSLLAEVTDDVRYKNVRLAKSIPPEP